MADRELDGIDEKSKLNVESPTSPSSASASGGDDTGKIKFQTKNQNGEAKIDICESGAGYQCGLTKEELMKFANDPFWVVLRRVLFVMFWLLWIGMLVGAVIIIIMTPRCLAPKMPEWYESSPVYVARVDKFTDAKDNQYLGGIVEKVPYLESIHVHAIALEGAVSSDDPSKLANVGTIEDFRTLSQKIKTLIKFRVDKLSLDAQEGVDKLAAAIKYWLEQGAAGFVFDGAEASSKAGDLSADWLQLINASSTEEFPRISVISSYESGDEAKFCPTSTMVVDYTMAKLESGYSFNQFYDTIIQTKRGNSSECRKTIALGSADVSPMKDRYSSQERDRIIMFSLMADATPFIYFGDEVGKSENVTGGSTRRALTRVEEGVNVEAMNWNLVEQQNANPKENNYLHVFSKSANLRSTELAIKAGESHIAKLSDSVVAMSRVKKGNPAFVVVTNFGDEQTVSFDALGSHIPETGHVDVISTNSKRNTKTKTSLKEFTIEAQETVILQFVPVLG